MKEFMLQFNKGQEYLITAEKLRFRYNRQGSGGITIIDMEMAPSMLASCLESKDNRDITTFYNGERLFNINIDTKSNPNLVIIKIDDPFPGYAPGHPVYQSLPYDAKAKPIERFFVKLDNGKAFERKEF